MRTLYFKLNVALLLPTMILLSCSKVSNKRDETTLIGPKGDAGAAGEKGDAGKDLVNVPKKASHIFIGAPDSSGTTEGSYYGCNFNAVPGDANCTNRKTKSSFKGNTSHATSLYASGRYLYIGAPNVGNIESDNLGTAEVGSLIQCELPPATDSCFIAKISPNVGDGLGFSVTGIGETIYVGAPYANTSNALDKKEVAVNKDSIISSSSTLSDLKYNIPTTAHKFPQGNGVVYRCLKSALHNCNIIEPANTYTKAEFGSSIFAVANNLYIGARAVNNLSSGTGIIFKCKLDGSDCSTLNITLKDNEKYDIKRGLFVTDKNLFLGVFIHKSGLLKSEYAVLKCDLNGGNCLNILIPSGEPNEQKYYSRFGASIFVENGNLYVGAPDYEKAGTRVGAVFKCNLNSPTHDCEMFKSGTKKETFGASIYIY